MRRLEQEPWWDELVALKDELSFRELAERFNATPNAIANALRRNRLDKRPAPSGPRAYRLGVPEGPFRRPKTTIKKIAEEPRVRPGSKDYLLQPAFHLLGKLPDAEIAERCGVSIRTVASYRARHNIAGYTGTRKRQPSAKKLHQSKIDAFAALVGVESDHEVALRAGVTPNAVRHYRLTRGISFSPASAPSPVTENVLPVPVAANTHCWLVRFDQNGSTVERVVVGDSLQAALLQGEAAGLGVVVCVERLGVFLAPQ